MLDLEKAVEFHRILWNEISRILKEDSISLEERDYDTNDIKEIAYNNILQMIEYDEGCPPMHHCFLCEYSSRRYYDTRRFAKSRCEFCPLCKNPDAANCLDWKYQKLCDAIDEGNWQIAANLSEQIRDLPVVNTRTY